ncbi:hypothetical protein EDB86DRAFT_1198977 [Lactarius hatsudake]|nr:hypothetical protein EDB86DRAFT_1198977 [Lactarius hatsudake]
MSSVPPTIDWRARQTYRKFGQGHRWNAQDTLPKDLTRTWEIVLFEQRDDVGGIKSELISTHCNVQSWTSLRYRYICVSEPITLVPGITFSFTLGVALFPNHTFILQYHKSMISRWNLSSYMRLRHEVLTANGYNVSDHWQPTALYHTINRTVHARFDHLIIAS